MTISGNVPQHLVVGARTGFLAALPKINLPYQKLAEIITLTAASTGLVDIGAAPMPMESKGRNQVQDFVERSMSLVPKNWEITVGISQNAIDDDQTGQLERKVKSASENFQRWINNQVFKALNDGDATTNFGACYDDLSFFNGNHVDKGADYQTVQDNVAALVLSLDNFETVKVAANKFLDDRGEAVGYGFDTLIISPELERIAAQICKNADAYDTGNRELNPYAGVTSYIVSPKFDTAAWVLAAANESAKPILIGQRKAPELQSAWFDPNGPDGGVNYFKFFARYVFVYGDWRLASMGHS